MSSEFSSFSFSIDRDLQVRVFGWGLLFFWVAAMVYIARDFFFPHLYGNEPHGNAYQKDDECYDQLLLNTEEVGEFV